MTAGDFNIAPCHTLATRSPGTAQHPLETASYTPFPLKTILKDKFCITYGTVARHVHHAGLQRNQQATEETADLDHDQLHAVVPEPRLHLISILSHMTFQDYQSNIHIAVAED